MEEFFAPIYGQDGEGKRKRPSAGETSAARAPSPSPCAHAAPPWRWSPAGHHWRVTSPRSAGRSWRASELRGKSYEDLHKLWWVCLKEKNALLTDRLYFTQVGVEMPDASRVRKVRKTMARIKRVLSERRQAVSRVLAEGTADVGEPLPAFSEETVDIKKFGRSYKVPVDHPYAQRPTRAEDRAWTSRQRRRDRYMARKAAFEAAKSAAEENLPEEVREWYKKRDAGLLAKGSIEDAIGRSEADTRFDHQEEGLDALRQAAAAEVHEAAKARAGEPGDGGDERA